MGKTFRTTRCFGSSQPFAAAASRPGHVLDENGAVDYPDAATLDPAEGRADRGTRHPSRTAPSERRQRVAVAVYHQARIANAALDGQTQQDEFGYLFSETFDGLVGNLAGVGLDVSVSRRRSEGVCISYIEPAHPRLCADNRHRQERRDSESPLLACLDYPWNPAVFAAGQRCRLLRGLQGAAHFWSVRAAVFVSGDPAHLPARRPTAVQWRGRRAQWFVGTCFLGAKTLQLVRTSLPYQSDLHPVVPDRLCAALLGDATPQEAQQHEPLHHLTARQIRQLPDPLPITDGKIHFIRQVEADGTISILNESWKVGKRWAGKYVWATLITHCRRLEIWYQSSAQHDWRLLHKYPYDISETVAHFNPDLACHRST